MTPIPLALVSIDNALVSSAKAGNTKAFRELVDRHKQMVHRFIFRLCQNAELSEEMTQEVFIKLYQNLDKYDVNRPLKPWLLKIASNSTLTALKKNNPWISLDALAEESPGIEWGRAPGSAPETENDPSLMMERQESAENVHYALKTLDSHYQQILLLRYQEDLAYDDIASILDIPINTVRTWLKRGRDKLKKQLQSANLHPGGHLK
ncbi:MAG: sigma-70 family RNA polymerase sigma factor [Cyanobacteria bacterium]|nr:sigma-70 family RNA polymerase sigma factor [Cyanobacteriota bacterium]